MDLKKLPSMPILQTKDSSLRDAFAEAYNRINAFIDATPSELGAAEEIHADTHKTGGTDALTPSDIGAATFAQGHAWKPNNAYSAGDMCFATDGTSSKYFECVIGGTSDTTEPTWPAIGGSVTDNTVEWLVRSTVPDLPIATDAVLGVIKIGTGLTVTTEGILSVKDKERSKLFTSSGTFTATTDTVYITGCGGGGGSTGGAYNGTDNYYGASGGGGAACIKTAITVVPGQSYAITVGAGGSAGTKSTSGGAGGATSFGALLSLAGGGGGSYSLNGSGAGGSAGGAGGSAGLSSNTLFGCGGSCIFGSHTVYNGSGAGVAGSNYGSGGAGGYHNKAGAAGSQGFILVEW